MTRSLTIRHTRRGVRLIGILAMGLLLGSSAAPAVPMAAEAVQLQLTPSSAQLAQCMPDASLDVTVKLTTDSRGFDKFDIRAKNLPPNRSFTVF